MINCKGTSLETQEDIMMEENIMMARVTLDNMNQGRG